MAGKNAVNTIIKKEKPKVSMTYIDDILVKLGKAEERIDKTEEDIDGMLETMDGIGLNELVTRVEKVEARLGIG